jgi:phage-related protein
VQFGDGYKQEMPDGLTGPLITWRIVCDNLEALDAVELEDFIRYRMRTGRRFQILHPDTAVPLTVSALSYRWTGTTGRLRSIEIELEEVNQWP